MIKAICIERLVSNNPFFVVEEGYEFTNVVAERDGFIFNDDIHMSRSCFFYHFKTDDPKVKMTYSDFEHILCNYLFTMALFLPQDINGGERFLIIKDWDNERIYISCDDKKNIIYVSFNHSIWKKYDSYEDALEGIRNHEWN